MSDELDPSIADLLNSAPADSSGHEEISITEFESDKKFDMNSFASKNNLFEKKGAPAASGPKSIHNVDLSVHEFAEITNFLSDTTGKNKNLKIGGGGSGKNKKKCC